MLGGWSRGQGCSEAGGRWSEGRVVVREAGSPGACGWKLWRARRALAFIQK